MNLKKAATLLFAGAIASTTFAFSTSALSYQYTTEDLEQAPVVFNGTPGAMDSTGKVDSLWEKVDAIDLKAMGNSIRIGLAGNMKLMWDKDNLHMLITVKGDSVAKAEGKEDFNTASFEDSLVVMLSQTWATYDPEAEEIYQRDAFNGSDLAFEARRMQDGIAPRIVKTATWGNQDIVNNTNSVMDKIKSGIQSHEINDGTTSFQMQLTIPWIDKALVEDGRVIGLDVDYGDWLGMGETYPGIFTEGSKVGKPHLYFSDNYAEGLDNPASNAPVILSAIPVGMDMDTALVMAMLQAIPDKGEITLNDEEAIGMVREMYDALNADQKAQLADVYSRLTDAEAKIAELKTTKPTDTTTKPNTDTTTKPSDDTNNDNPTTGAKGIVLPIALLAAASGAFVLSRRKATR